MKTRAQVPETWQALGLTGTAVEVGTYQGEFAQWILDHWPGQLIVVDRWRHDPNAHDILNHDQKDFEAVYQACVARLHPYAWRCEVLRKDSADAARLYQRYRQQFDAIYLDASHDYGSVMADLVSWWPLVKDGGWFGGHDYLNGTMAEGFPADFGVKQAVDEFAAAHGLEVSTTTDDPFPTWWVFK